MNFGCTAITNDAYILRFFPDERRVCRRKRLSIQFEKRICIRWGKRFPEFESLNRMRLERCIGKRNEETDGRLRLDEEEDE